jgi:hypothetical protein
MESITIQLSQRAYDGFVAAGNSNNRTAEDLVGEFVENQGIAYANILEVGRITPATFIRRLTVPEFTAITQAADIDLVIRGLVQTLISRPFIDLTDPALEQGLRIIAARVEGFDSDRISDLLHYDRPQPAPEIPAE